MPDQDVNAPYVYIGTYTSPAPHVPDARGKGIHVCRMDPSTGRLTNAFVTTGIDDPSFLTIDPRKHCLYAVSEVFDWPDGLVSAYAIDPQTKQLRLLNRQPSRGRLAAYVEVDKSGRLALVANYLGGTAAVFPIAADGSLEEPTDVVRHSGSGVDPRRQESPHPHAIVVDPTNRYAFVPDLGIDKVMRYRLDVEHGRLQPGEDPATALEPGSGPRHLEFHTGGRLAYLIQELGSTITAFRYEPDRGGLRRLQTVSTLPEGFAGESHCADIHVHPSGRFVYGSNRGHDSIVAFAADQEGRLTYAGHEATRGRTPRNFAIDSTGTFLLAANQDSHSIVTFRIDQESGRLSFTGEVADVPSPVCVKIVQFPTA
jgi:6-phosphogluconolactonase